jgi:ABC-type Na+ transport system ATPase subunit NatA
VVERLCDSLAIINKGRIVIEGTMADVRARAEGQSAPLEEIFVRAVGAEALETSRPDWL